MALAEASDAGDARRLSCVRQSERLVRQLGVEVCTHVLRLTPESAA